VKRNYGNGPTIMAISSRKQKMAAKYLAIKYSGIIPSAAIIENGEAIKRNNQRNQRK